jgi:hypothetical protein
MFNLDKSIEEWRRQMLAVGIKTPVPLEELESHLREEIAWLMKSGLNAQKAFEISASRMGQPEILKSEFKKVERTSMKKISIFALLVGAVIVLRILTHQPDASHLRRNEQVGWLITGSAILLFGFRNLLFNSNSGDSRDIRRWKLVGITYSMVAVWISIFPILLFLTEPRYSAALGTTGRILTFMAVAVSFLSVFGWRMSRRILPIVPSKQARTHIGIACCLLGPALAAIFWFSIARQLHFSIGVILITWTWAVMAILGGVGYGLAETARGQTGSARS